MGGLGRTGISNYSLGGDSFARLLPVPFEVSHFEERIISRLLYHYKIY